MPSAEQKAWTAAEVRRLRDEQDARPFGKRVQYQVVDGELLVTPAPRPVHQYVVQSLTRLLEDFVEPRRIGFVLGLAADMEMDPHTDVQPDVFVAPLVNGRRPLDWNDLGALLLVVEVLSPGTARYDRVKKRARYQRAGIPEYWIVDADARTVERWRPEDERPEVLAGTLTWRPAGTAEAFVVDLPAFFARAWDEGSADG